MVTLSILGLNWCQHACWKIVLCEQGRGRRLQVTLTPGDAVVVGHELAQHPSERAGLYSLVGSLLRQQPHQASVVLALSESNRARTALVVHADEGEKSYVTSAADGVALAVRARLPIMADEALPDAFGVEGEAAPAELPTEAPAATPIRRFSATRWMGRARAPERASTDPHSDSPSTSCLSRRVPSSNKAQAGGHRLAFRRRQASQRPGHGAVRPLEQAER